MHTHTHTEKERELPQRDCSRGWKTRIVISPRRLQLTSGIKSAQFLLPICIASKHTHTHTHTHMWEVWVSGREWLQIYYNNKLNWVGHRSLGVGSCSRESTRNSRKLFVCHVIYTFSPWNAKYLRLPKPPLVRLVLSNMLVVLIDPFPHPSSWPTYDLCIWEEQSKCNHLNMYLHIVQECGFSYLRWLLLFNQIRTHTHTPAHMYIDWHTHQHTHVSAYRAGQHVQ